MPNTNSADQLTKRYQELTQRRQQILLDKAGVESSIQHHKKEYDECMSALFSEFNVTTLEAANELREAMQAELESELVALQAAITEYDSLSPAF